MAHFQRERPRVRGTLTMRIYTAELLVVPYVLACRPAAEGAAGRERTATKLPPAPWRELIDLSVPARYMPVSARIPPTCGAVAQLGERLNGIQEVEGSTPFGSTLPFPSHPRG